jgi:hypothetical protein
MGISFPLVRDDLSSFNEWGGGVGMSSYPLDVVVDRDGVVTHVGHEYEPSVLQAAIESAL